MRIQLTRLKNREGRWLALFVFLYMVILGLYSRLPRDPVAEEAYWEQTYPHMHLVGGCAFVVASVNALLQNCLFEMDAFRRSLSLVVFYIYVVSGVSSFAVEWRWVPVYFDTFGKIFSPTHFLSWGATTPLMVYILSHISNFSTRDTVQLILIDLAAIFCGLLSLCALPARISLLAGLAGLSLFVLLMHGFLRMYATGIASVLTKGSRRIGVVGRRAASGIQAQVYLTVALWHVFPTIWFLANVGLISGGTQELAWTALNLFSKILFATSTLLSNLALVRSEQRAHEILGLEAVIQRETFLGSIARELRVPIDGIIGLAETLVHSGELEPRRLRCFQLIHHSGSNLLALVNDIVDLLASRSGELAVEWEEIDMAELIQQVVAVLSPLAGPHVALQYKLMGFLPKIKADRRRLIQILNNLVGNALKFTREGSVTVIAQFSTEEDGLIVHVADTGIGIPEEHLRSIFEEFEQVTRHVRREFGGAGLGLTIVKELVELHRGRIGVASRVGLGSTFSVLIPRNQDYNPLAYPSREHTAIVSPAETTVRHVTSQEHELSVEVASQPFSAIRAPYAATMASDFPESSLIGGGPSLPAPALRPRKQRHREVNGGKIRVLSVDDDEVNQMVMQEILQIHGLEMESVMDGEAAIRYLQEAPCLPDLMLLDMMMPGLSGIDVAIYVRTRLGIPTADLPIIMVSALSSMQVVKQAREAGCDDYILKPVGPKNVMAAIHSLVPPTRAILRIPTRTHLDDDDEDDEDAASKSAQKDDEEKDPDQAHDHDDALPPETSHRRAETTKSVRGSLQETGESPHLSRRSIELPPFAGASAAKVTADGRREIARRFMESVHVGVPTVTATTGGPYESPGAAGPRPPEPERQPKGSAGFQIHRDPRKSSLESLDPATFFKAPPADLPAAASPPDPEGSVAAALRRGLRRSVQMIAAADNGAAARAIHPRRSLGTMEDGRASRDRGPGGIGSGLVRVEDLRAGRADRLLAASTAKPTHRFQEDVAGAALILTIEPDLLSQSLIEAVSDSLPNVKIVHTSRPTGAVEYLQLCRRLPDVIVLEQQMAEMMGSELVAILRRSFSPLQLPIVMISDDPRASDAALQAGCNRFIAKPLDVRLLAEDLLAVMEETGGLPAALLETKAALHSHPRSPHASLASSRPPSKKNLFGHRGSTETTTTTSTSIRRSIGSVNNQTSPGFGVTSGNLRAAAAAILEDKATPIDGGAYYPPPTSAPPQKRGISRTPSLVHRTFRASSYRNSSSFGSGSQLASSVTAATTAVTSATAAAAAAAGGVKTVLCLVSSEEYTAAVKQGARAAGTLHQVQTFSACLQAMAQLLTSREDPCLAVVDLDEETAARAQLVLALRERGGPGLSVLALGGEEHVDLALELQCDDFLTKPLSARKLQLVVERFLTF